MKSLDSLKVGQTATVKHIYGEGALSRRILDMGLTKGVKLSVERLAPLGDPMELKVRGYSLSLRKADARNIEIE